MDDTNNQDYILKENGQFLTDEEILKMDGILLKTNEEIMKKAGEIGRILGNSDSVIRRLREAYLSATAILKEKDAALEDKIKALKDEEKAKQELMNRFDLLQQKYMALEAENDELRDGLNGANREKDKILGQIQGLKAELSEQGAKYQTLEAESKRIQEDYKQHYTDARTDKEQAESNLKQCQDALVKERGNAEILQERLDRESAEKEEKAREAEDLKGQLLAETGKVSVLNEEIQQYELQRQKMPALMRLYDAYNGVMEKRNEFPQEFFERLQNVVPLDDFDSFLSRVLKQSFPISYYLSVQSFITVCSHRGEVSGEAMKKALCTSDDLLSAVFDFGSEYFEEEKLSRIDIEAGNQFDSYLCKYIDENGGMYGNIVKVWLHGFRDEKNDKVYCSYVEGE